jgi:hypothetical protein
MALSYKNRQMILEKFPEIAEALDELAGHTENIAGQVNASLTGTTNPPSSPAALTVTAAQGIFDARIDDTTEVNRGIHYFLEYSKSPSFNKPTTIHLGASRNFRAHLGNQTLYWRAHSSYPTSPRSTHVYHGTSVKPIAVLGGGPITGPEPLPSAGSGTSNGASDSDGAFGNNPTRRIRVGS